MTVDSGRSLHRLLSGHLTALVEDGQASAVAAAAIRDTDECLLHLGHTAWKGGHPVAATTRFEIGSVTKTCTGLLLAELVRQGRVHLDDPLVRHLPASATPRDPRAARITLRQLATHTAGLPALPWPLWRGMLRATHPDPYADYRIADLYRGSIRLRPRHPPGSRIRYSTLGIALLGQALANATGTDYPELLTTRILDPLAMTATATSPTPADATGHRRRRPVPPWRFQALAPAGALHSTATDMLAYLRAHLHPESTPLTQALRTIRTPPHPTWNRHTTPRHAILWHTGGTGGFTSYLGFSLTTATGLVVLANTRASRRQPVIGAARRILTRLLSGSLDPP